MSDHKNQAERILSLLKSRADQWVPLPEILDLRISQYGARIYSLRKHGHRIENRKEHTDSGTHSWFRLVTQ